MQTGIGLCEGVEFGGERRELVTKSIVDWAIRQPTSIHMYNWEQLQQLNIQMKALDKYRPFKSAGDDFADSNPIFSYYFYQYFLEAAIDIGKDVEDPMERNQIEQEIGTVEKLTGKMQSSSKIAMDKQQNMQDMLEYTELMFAKNEHQFQQNFRSKQMAEDFLSIHRLYELIKHFNGLNDQQNKRRVFAKKRFIDLMKELKNKPQSKMQESQPPPPPPPPKIIEQKIKASVFKAPLPKVSTLVSFDTIQMQMQANKRLENAISELSFDRFKFAKEEVLHALELLEQLSPN